MKFSSTSSPSSVSCTSYTTSNYDDNLCHSKPATAGCIRDILRRFLCFNSLPTHPSDLFKEEAAIACQTQDDTRSNVDTADASATPGLVARLMGLDSMPMVNCANLNSVRRTRSMDSLRDVELVQGKHRHVKSTMSFREAPTFLELENEDFFILSFESGGEYKELGSKPRNCNLTFSEMRTKRLENKNGDKNNRRQNVKQSDKENQETNKKLQGVRGHNNSKDTRTVLCPIKINSNSPEIVNQKIKKPINNKETGERGKLRKKKKEQSFAPLRKVETETDSENASPVSVLDFSELPIEFKVHSSVHNARLTTSNSRRALVEELKSYNSSPSITGRIVNDREVKRIGDECAKIWKRSNKHSQIYAEMWGEVCKFAETDLRQSKWMYRVLDIEEFDEITATFEFEILDQLLQELVDQVFSL